MSSVPICDVFCLQKMFEYLSQGELALLALEATTSAGFKLKQVMHK